ncbi:hypothetical protein, partial [Nostoc sp. CHAB 5715]|uniref:RipA family octameric membrane protein n=1 Tax=Nostoc sp. CHAB 5715 TaxID=2780400 RepID=UPI001E442EAE
SRLNFQDDYLFKFSTVFLTAHGALAALAGSTYLPKEKAAQDFSALILLSIVGLILATAWVLWIRHNDYWHSVWIGTLRDIEQNHLKTDARVFFTVEGQFARSGTTPPFLRGHHIAQLIPVGLCIAWGLVFIVALCRRFQ